MPNAPIIRRESKAKEKMLAKKAWQSCSFGADPEKGQRLGYWVIEYAVSKGLKTAASELIEDCLVHAWNTGKLQDILGAKLAEEIVSKAYPGIFAKKTRKPKKRKSAFEGTD